MKTINSILNDYLEIFNSYVNPQKIRDKKIDKLINNITGDGNSKKKITGIKAFVSEDMPSIPSLNYEKDKSSKKMILHEFYSPSNEF